MSVLLEQYNLDIVEITDFVITYFFLNSEETLNDLRYEVSKVCP
jgi:hypothetical protein